eukprot:scaffold122044_cov35-Phaeocystis_antarctica.AAC.2
MAAAWRLRLELMLHLLEQAPLRHDQFAQVTDVIAGGNRHRANRQGHRRCARCGAALPPSIATPSFRRCAGLALSIKQCSYLTPFYRNHRFTRQDSQTRQRIRMLGRLTLRVTLDNQNVC